MSLHQPPFSASTSVECLNCGTRCEGSYCSNCGQSTNTQILDWKFLWNDLRFLLFSYDQSIFLTLHALLTHPGRFIREFMDGKRVKRFHPLRLTLTLSGFYLALHSFQPLVNTQGSDDAARFAVWILKEFPWFMLLQVPMMAIASYLCFRPARWTWAEHFGLSGYLVSQHLVLRFLGLVCSLVFSSLTGSDQRWVWFSLTEAISSVYATWTLMTLFTQLHQRTRVLRSLASLLLFLLLNFGAILVIAQMWIQITGAGSGPSD